MSPRDRPGQVRLVAPRALASLHMVAHVAELAALSAGLLLHVLEEAGTSWHQAPEVRGGREGLVLSELYVVIARSVSHWLQN